MPMHTNPFQYKHLLSRRHASKSFKILLQDTFLPNSFFNLENFDIDSFPRGFKGRDRFFKGNWSINYKVEIGLLVEHLKTFFDELDESFKQLVFHRLLYFCPWQSSGNRFSKGQQKRVRFVFVQPFFATTILPSFSSTTQECMSGFFAGAPALSHYTGVSFPTQLLTKN